MLCEIQLKKNNLVVGSKAPVSVNCNVGINEEADRTYEIERLKAIKDNDCQPDTFMDLSIGQFNKPFYKEIQERFDCPVGFVPSYLFSPDKSISKQEAVDILKRLADDGIAFVTLHFTATKELYGLAKVTRKIPVTSRGGSAVLQQQERTGGENIWMACLPEIIKIAKEYGMVVSLGSIFRPAGIQEACDEVHLKETEEQLKLCRMLQAEGVQVMVENVGHIAIDQLEQHCQRLREFNAPIMPLGPIPTDCAIGADHTAAAVGAAFMGYWGCAHIINCITRAEHSKSKFTIEETLEAIRTAKLTAHIIDMARGIGREEDARVFEQRAKEHNCLAEMGGDCTRCDRLCPLKNI
jgi:phosphomethylpyrimidine synthase